MPTGKKCESQEVSKHHKVGKSGTGMIERDNSNMRHHLGRFTRRTKIVSKQVAMVDNAIKICAALTAT